MRIFKRGGSYALDVTIDGVRIRRGLKTRNKGEAQRRALSIIAEVEAQSEVTPWRRKNLLVAPLIGRYLDHHYAAKPDPRRRRERSRILMLVLAGCKYVRHLTTSRLSAGLRDAAAARGWAATTQNTYRDIVSSFCTWLHGQGLLRDHPARRIPKLPEPPRRVRRSLTVEELVDLLEAAPLRRASVYAVAAGVGLRRCELRRLEWRDVDLGRALLFLRAETTKERRPATLPLSSWVVDFLTRWRSVIVAETGGAREKAPTGLVWSAIPHHKTVQRDLTAAGIEPKTSEGVVDLHALRVTAATLMARAQVSIQTAMRLLRHRDPRLTINVYTKLVDEDLRAGVESLKLPGYPRRREEPRGPRGWPE